MDYKDALGFLSSSYVVRQACKRQVSGAALSLQHNLGLGGAAVVTVVLWLYNTTSGWGEQPW